jgi:hypothetical protein
MVWEAGVMHTLVSKRGSPWRNLGHPHCARSVHESNVFGIWGLAFERKQIPRFVENVSS